MTAKWPERKITCLSYSSCGAGLIGAALPEGNAGREDLAPPAGRIK